MPRRVGGQRDHDDLARVEPVEGAHLNQRRILGEDLAGALADVVTLGELGLPELGGRLGVSRQAVNAIETGKYDPSLPLAFKIARLFDQPIEEIFDDQA